MQVVKVTWIKRSAQNKSNFKREPEMKNKDTSPTGKGERKLFSTRYKAEIKIGSLPEKKSSEKISGPNPSFNTFPVPKISQKTVFNKNNIMKSKNKPKKNSNKKNAEKKKNLLNLLKKESAQKKQNKKNSSKSFDFRKPRLEFGRKTSGLSQVWTH